ncbi:hypothetical protein [Haloferula sargassicola]|uniref:Uncharacterized protein n=1 Tax=Haloferula sargassicola TaxID=490096 RepID=A0ABP9UM90_9BACT
MKWVWLLLASLLVTASPLAAAEEDRGTPGVALAQGVTEITGVAISPLLGVSVVGSWTYLHTPQEQRTDLPWYAQPWAWCTGYAVLLLCFLKDSLGATAPGILKKPFDLAELLENKASALVASAAFVPLVAREMARATGPVEAPAAILGMPFMAMIDASWITVPLALMAFGLIWICSHSINVLIILSPFSSVDALLKLARTAMLATVAIAYAIAPWLGAAVCGVILLAAIWYAPAAMRLTIFGTRLAFDVVFGARGRARADISRPHAFLLRKTEGLPSRIGGRLAKNAEGGIEFRYRRGCLGPERSVLLPPGRLELAKGLLMPVLLTIDGEDESRTLLLLPRYRGREAEVSEALGFHAVRDHAWKRGWAAVKLWWRETAGRRIES